MTCMTWHDLIVTNMSTALWTSELRPQAVAVLYKVPPSSLHQFWVTTALSGLQWVIGPFIAMSSGGFFRSHRRYKTIAYGDSLL